MSSETVREIGFWVVRLSLVGAAIYFAINENTDYAVGFGIAAWWSFIFTE